MINSKFENAIWTDNEKTRFLIWEAYVGYIEAYNNYMMYETLNTVNPVIMAGLNRYANYFFEEVRYLFDDFKEKLVQKEIDKTELLFNSSREFNKTDYVFLRRFFSKFMHVSGIKAVVMKKDRRTNHDKIRAKYDLGAKENE